MVDPSQVRQLIALLLVIVFVWIITWALLYNLFGIYLGSITINNGILFNNIKIHLRSIHINLESFRFRLWGNSKKLIISGFEVVIIPKKTDDESQFEDSIDPPKNHDSTTPLENDTNPDLESDPSFPDLNIYPSNSILKFIIKFFICRLLPNIDIELKRSLIRYKDRVSKLEFLRINSLARYSNQIPDNYKFKFEIICNYFQNYSHQKNNTEFPLLSLDAIKFDLKFVIGLSNGEISGIKLKLFTDDMKVLVFKLAKLFKPIIESKLENPSNPSSKKPKPGKSPNSKSKSQKIEHYLKKLNSFYRKFDEIGVLSENIHILEIPFITSEYNKTFSEFLDNAYPITSLELIIKSISFNILKMSEDSAGFHALFDSADDLPIFFSNSIQLLTVNYSVLHFKGDLISKKSMEILNLPNYSANFKGNFLDKFTKNEGFKDCVAEVFLTCSNPILDLNSAIIASAIYNLVVVKKYLELNKVYRHYKDLVNENVSDSDNSNDELDDTLMDTESTPTLPSGSQFGSSKKEMYSSSKTPLKDKMWKFLQEYYPRLDLKLIIEQPRIIISHSNKKLSGLQILNFQYSTLNLQVITTSNRDYELKSQVLQPAIHYIDKLEKSKEFGKDSDTGCYHGQSKRFEILSIRSLNFKVDILKGFKLKFNIELNNFDCNLSNLSPLLGFSLLLRELMSLTEKDLKKGHINSYLNTKLLKYKKIILRTSFTHPHRLHSSNSDSKKNKIFNFLPDWFVELNIRLNLFKAQFGSKSVLIPNEELIADFLANRDKKEYVTINENLTGFRFSFESFNYNIKNDLAGSLASPPRSSSSLDTLTSNDNKNTYWVSAVKLDDLEISIIDNSQQSPNGDFAPLLKIPVIATDLSSNKLTSSNKLEVSTKLDQLDGNFDYFKLFIIVSSIHLLKENLIDPLKATKVRLKQAIDTSPKGNVLSSKEVSESNLLSSLSFCLKLKKSDILFTLHDNYKLKLDIYQTKVELLDKQICLNNKFLRVLTESPTLPENWCRLVCIDDIAVKLKLTNKDLIFIDSSLIKFIHPHGHVTHKLFDNISITLKILKHLVKMLKVNSSSGTDNSNGNESTIIHPSESPPKKLPNVNLKSKRLLFQMEDDPFESELGMIYQLGKIEQRKRLELNSVFEAKSAGSRSEPEDIEENLEELHKMMADSWIRKIKTYKKSLNDEIVKNKKFLFGNEARLEPKFQKGIQPYSIYAPLISIVMDNLDLDISSPKFELSKLPKYMNELGQGLPLDTRYSLNLPTFINMRLKELRMHLRDYPLPLLYVPANPKNPDEAAVKMSGHLIIAENFVTNKENIRTFLADLFKNTDDVKFEDYYRLTIEKTLSSVKLYTDMNVNFVTSLPSRFVWGQSYQFGIQQVMLNFDQFSKPPVDPSSKLGFWDKLRLVMHGRFTIKCGEVSEQKSLKNNKKLKQEYGPLEVAFKGSRDPYDLFRTSTGFILSFKDNVTWTVNENDDSRLFCNVKSDKVSWYIPNYLASPLVAWMKDSNKTTYLPDSEKFITSCFAYYLDDESHSSSKDNKSFNVFEKKVISLSGGVDFKVGFVLQRDDAEGNKTEDCKPHYEINLFNPQYTGKDHDSYRGFRSDYINMAISLDANFTESYNSIHLSPGVFNQFFNWWKLFAGNMQLPIRKGKLFGELKKSTKFSQHLISNRFCFNFKSLFISHVYRDSNISQDEDFVQSYGLRGKMEDFIVEARQRKEDRISIHEELSRNKKIKKMNFHIADIHLNGIDLRLLSARFDQNLYGTSDNNNVGSSTYKIFDNDKQWFDIEDYEEVFLPTLANNKRIVHILPLMFSERFSYLRDTEPDARFNEIDLFNSNSDVLGQLKDIFKTEKELIFNRIKQIKDRIKVHKTKGLTIKPLIERVNRLQKEINNLSKQETSYVNKDRRLLQSNINVKFHNKFIVIGMLLKWNNKNRNLFYKYIHFVKLRSFLRKYLTFESISALEDLISNPKPSDDNEKENDENENGFIENPQLRHEKPHGKTPKYNNSQDRINGFDEILREVSRNETVEEDYLIEILSPQIQLQSDETPDSVVIITSPKIDGKIVSVYDKSKDQMLVDLAELENRYGCVVNNANVLVFDKQQKELSLAFIFDTNCYGSQTNWPPWLGIEICQDASLAGDEHLLLENTSTMVTYHQLKPLAARMSSIDDEVDYDYGATNDDDAGTSDSDNESNYFDTQAHHTTDTISQRLCVDIPKVNITSTASQYYSLYCIVMDLLLYSEPSNEVLNDKLEKLKFSVDLQDLSQLYKRIKLLHFQNRLVEFMCNNYNFRQDSLNNEHLNEYLGFKLLQGDIVSEIYLLMHSILAGSSNSGDFNKQPKAQWIINTDEIILHMLEDNRTPILDIAMAQGKFRRIVNEDDSNVNKIEILMMQGFNLLANATFPAFLEPLDPSRSMDESNLITVDWSMAKNVGGIKLIENFEIHAQPLSLRMDEITGQRLMNYIFRTEKSLDDSEILNNKGDDNSEKKNVKGKNDKDHDDEEDSDTDIESSSIVGFVDESKGSNRPNKHKHLDVDSTDQQSVGKHSQSKLKSINRSVTQSSLSNEDYDEQIEDMVARSKQYISINNLRLNPVSLLVSMKLKTGYKRLLNVENFHLEFPELTIQRKILSVLELTMLMKKIILKAIFGHLGGLVKNKLKRHKKAPVNAIRKPLTPIKRYATFTPIRELREDTSQSADKK